MSRPHLKLKARMLMAGIRDLRCVSEIFDRPEGGAFRRAVKDRPHLLGALIGPYQCAAWDRRERLWRMAHHYEVWDRAGEILRFGMREHVVLASLDDLHPGTEIVLDQSMKFVREGGLALNLTVDGERIYSLAFSLAEDDAGRRGVVIGNMQGRNLDHALDLYRDLTKAFHGLRPRDLMLEALRALCAALKIDLIHAVSDASRIHRHPYFGRKRPIQQSYDEIWIEQGGARVSDDFFALAVRREPRDLSEVKPNKRSMYRRRYAFLEGLEDRIARSLENRRRAWREPGADAPNFGFGCRLPLTP